jgi:hypothetical protein
VVGLHGFIGGGGGGGEEEGWGGGTLSNYVVLTEYSTFKLSFSYVLMSFVEILMTAIEQCVKSSLQATHCNLRMLRIRCLICNGNILDRNVFPIFEK